MHVTSAARRLTALGLLIAAGVAGNLWWIYRFRRGLPFNIDESGYLQRAVLYSQLLRSHGLAGVAKQWTAPDIVGPVLPVTTGIIRAIVNINPWQMLGTQQIFYALTIFATYLLARQLTTKYWALAPAAVVACTPGVIDAGRFFYLAEPATAFFTLLLALQLRAGNFSSFSRSILWGVALGATALTRTIMVAFVAAPFLAALVRLIASAPTKRTLGNFASGSFAALFVAGSWYAWSWHTVLKYLTVYGYGSEAGSYGHSHSITTLSWWTARLNDIVNQDIYAPIAIALVLSGIVALAIFVIRRESIIFVNNVDFTAKAKLVLSGNEATLLLSLIGTYIVLSTSQNGGSYFELPLVPPLVALMLSPLANLQRAFGYAAVACAMIAAGLAVTDQLGVLQVSSNLDNVDIIGLQLTSFAQAGITYSGNNQKLINIGGVWWSNCGGATITCFYGRSSGITAKYLTSWDSLNKRVSTFLYQFSEKHERQPVVFFAAQGPLLNTNSIALAAQLNHRSLPIGALDPPSRRQGASLQTQLESPIYGQPNLVITVRASGIHHGKGSSEALINKVAKTLRGDGFEQIRQFTLPDNWRLLVWWKNR